MARKLEVEIVGDASSLSNAFGKAGHATGGFGSALGKIGKIAAGASLALGAGLAAGVGVGIKSLMAHEKVNAATAAVLKSTGNAAGVTARQIRELADSLEKKTGVDDVAIQNAENVLATFTNVRNEVEKGNFAFSLGTRAALDMSVALGTDLQSATIQVGKALNDPIKGLTALSRVGVSFTQGQKDQIKAMVESGDVMGAQKVILKELQKEFGGAAEAAGGTLVGRLNILKARLEEVAERVAARVLPIFEKFVNWVEQHWPAIQGVVEAVFSAVGTAITAFINIVRPIFDAIVSAFRDMQMSGADFRRDARGVFSSVASFISDLWSVAEPIFNAIRDIITRVVIPVLRELWDIARAAFDGIARALSEHEPEIRRIMDAIGTVMRTLGTIIREVVQNVIAPILRFVFGDVLPTVIGIAITAISLVVRTFQGMGTAVAAVVNAVREVVSTAWNVIATVTTTVWNAVSLAVTTVVNAIRTLVTTGTGEIRTVVQTAWNAIRDLTTTVWGAVRTAITTVVGAIRTVVTTAVGAVRTAVTTAWNAVDALTTRIWGEIRTAITTAMTAVRDRVADLVGNVRQAIFGAWDAVREKTANAWNAVLAKIRDVMGDALSAVRNLVGAFFNAAADIGRRIVDGVLSGVGSLGGRLRDAVEGGIRSALSAINPFSPIEVGAARLIGQPIVQGAIDGVAGMAKELRRTLESQVGGALRSATFGSLALPTPAVSMGTSFTGGGDAGTAIAGGGGFIGGAFGSQEITIRVPVTLDGRILTEVVYQGLLDRSRSSGSLFSASPGVRL